MISRYDRDLRTGPSVLTSSESRPSTSGLIGRLTVFLCWLGSLVSIALMAGIGNWAANLGSRDISEIPVIRAMEGHARTRSIDPGGRIVGNQGLSINQVIESGIAAEAPDTVVLAPRPMPLDPGDTVAPEDRLIDATEPPGNPDCRGGGTRGRNRDRAADRTGKCCRRDGTADRSGGGTGA